MNQANQNFIRPGYEAQPDPEFPNAPFDWSRQAAEEMARVDGFILTEAHWRVVRALQEFHARNEASAFTARELHDALDEAFHQEGGIKYLYELFPKGPLAQGCLLAGLQPPGGTQDKGFGSAV